MKTALDYIDDLKAAKGWPSDYRVAKELQISQPTMSHYRAGRSIPNADVCAKVAEALGISLEEVLSAAEREREERAGNTEAVARWRVRWERVTSGATAAGIALLMALPPAGCILRKIQAQNWQHLVRSCIYAAPCAEYA